MLTLAELKPILQAVSMFRKSLGFHSWTTESLHDSSCLLLKASLKASSAELLKQLSAVIVRPQISFPNRKIQHEWLPNHIYKRTGPIPFFGHCRRFTVVHSLQKHTKTFLLWSKDNPVDAKQHESNEYYDLPTFHTTLPNTKCSWNKLT